jgi:hypothetical protein
LKNFMIILLLAGLLAFGCLGDGTSMMDSGGTSAPSAPRALMMEKDSGSAGIATTQYITKEGSVSIKVNENELAGKYDLLKSKLSDQGAKMGDIRFSESTDRKQYTITVRLAPTKFEAMMAAIQDIGQVKDMSVNLEDVTQQYIDLDTRIKNDQIELSRLYDLYNQSSKVSDLLDVEREITRVETELEMYKNQKQYLDSRIDLSTIYITIYEEKPASTQLSLSIDNLGAMFFGAVGVAITLIVLAAGFLLPIALIIGVLWLIYKAVFGKKKSSGPRKNEHDRIPPPE